jgi:hypothetical protein
VTSDRASLTGRTRAPGGFNPLLRAGRRCIMSAIHRPAVTAWLRSVPPAGEVAAFVAEASWHTRRHVYRQLRRFRHPAVADELIDAVWERFGDEEAASLLTACSADVVMRLLPWGLAGGAGVLAAGSAHPLRVLDLLERYAPAGSLPGALDRYAVLAAADTVRVARLMAEPGRERWLATKKLPRSLLRHLARLDTTDLAPVAQRLRRRESALVALLKAVPPRQRAALYDAAYADMDRSQSRPSARILDVLPRARRWVEARRVLELGPDARPCLVAHPRRGCRSSDQHAARRAWQALPGWAPWTPDISTLITERLTDLGDRTLWRLAVPPLIALLGTGMSGSLLREVTGQLAGLDRASRDSC